MKKLKIGGVPEHFNMPWHLLLKKQKFGKPVIKGTWKDFPEGTGAMIDALNRDELDVAILLTEGAIKGIDKGGKYKIISFYIESPLIWGIHVPATSDLQKEEDIEGKTYAISRLGSGSHLMAFVDAQQRGWLTDNLQFEIVNHLDGAREAFKSGKAEVFLWEKFTTKKYVDNGEFRRVGETPTPYPCFVICANENALANKRKSLKKLLKEIFNVNKKLMKDPEAVSTIANFYDLQKSDVKTWIKDTKWAKKKSLKPTAIKKAIKILKRLALINKNLKYKQVISKL